MSNLRESQAYSKNFVTGDIVETTKMKEISNVRAVHKVELFEEGKKIQEVMSENFLSMHTKAWQALYAKMAATMAFSEIVGTSATGGYYTSYSAMHFLKENGNSLSHPYRAHTLFGSAPATGTYNSRSPLSWMVLTDDTSAEAPAKEALLKGTVIGYAEREGSYSGTDTLRGTWNKNESYIGGSHAHFVYDFGTDKANGTFNSICWAANTVSGEIVNNGLCHEIYDLTAPTGYAFNSTHAGAYKKKGDVIYVGVVDTANTNNKGIAKYTWNATNGVYDYTSVVAIALGANKLVAFDINSTGIIYTQELENPGAASVYKVHVKKWSATGAADTTFTTLSFDAGDSDYGTHSAGLALIGDGYLAVSYGNTTYYGYTKVYNLADMTVPSTYNHAAYKIPRTLDYDSVNGTLIVQRYYHNAHWYGYDAGFDTSYTDTSVLNVTTAGVISANFEISGYPIPTVNTGGITYKNADNNYVCETTADEPVNTSTTKLYRGYLGTLGGRNLLPAAVTKSSTQTMKITYDLYFD